MLKIKRNSLDALMSEYVRKRAHGYCERCAKFFGWQSLQSCHYHSRRKLSVRYDDANLIACCFGCHEYFHENPEEFKAFMKMKLGERGLDMLDSRARVTWPRPDEVLIALWLKQEIAKLEKEG